MRRSRRVLLGGLAAFSLLAGSLWCGFVMQTEGDPLFGAHAAYFCPRVCGGCAGPYVHLNWSSSSNGQDPEGHSRIYCQPRGGGLAGMSKMDLLAAQLDNQRFELPWGIFNIWLSCVALFFVGGFPLALIVGAHRLSRSLQTNRPPGAAEHE